MKSVFLPFFCFLLLLVCSVSRSIAAPADISKAQIAPASTSPPLLDVATYAGVTIQGTIGKSYSLFFAPTLDPASAWQKFDTIVLTNTVQVWIDFDSPKASKRFYQAVETNPSGPAVVTSSNATFDVRIPPGPNFEVAAFRWWHPPETKTLLGIVVLVPGSNSDGRADVEDSFWQDFARQHSLGLVGCWFTDHPHENMNIEDYARAHDGSGRALLDAVDRLAKAAAHPEAATAPLLLWGLSAGGEFNYEFACWEPARVAAFVVNKGGFYFTHLAPAATRAVPGIFFIGGKDEDFRIQSIQGIFAVNLRAGAAWKLIVEPDAGHELGGSRELAVEFFTQVISPRR